MQDSNPDLKLEIVPGTDGDPNELQVNVSDEVGFYTFVPDVDAQELVMISPSSGYVFCVCLFSCVWSRYTIAFTLTIRLEELCNLSCIH